MKRTTMILAAAAACALIAALAWAAPERPEKGEARARSPGDVASPAERPPGDVVAVRPPYAPYRRYGYGFRYGWGYRYRHPRYYVVAEKRGPEITWAVFEWTSQVYARLTVLATEKRESEAFNASLAAEVAALRAEIAGWKREKAALKDDDDEKAAKAQALDAQIAAAESQIAAKEAAARAVVQWVARGPFDSRRLDDFLTQLEREAYQARLKAGLHPVRPAPVLPPRSGY